MTRQEKVNFLRSQIHHDNSILRFWRNHPNINAVRHDGRTRRSVQTHWARTSLRIAKHSLYKIQTHYQTYSTSTAGWPPHHQLWLCIHKNEGPWNDTSAPYYGGLQMHADWYGLGNAGYYSESVQEWTAERAYKANGYSYSFLYGQWFEWDNADYCNVYA